MTTNVPNSGLLLDWKAAETAAVEHMKTLGFIDAIATAPGADGGIDALSSDAAAQVKFLANPVGRPDIQRIRGAAHEYRLALFYSTGGYTREAIDYANQASVALFLMDPYGACRPFSELATLLDEPQNVLERKQHLEELQAFQYQLAAHALKSDFELHTQFVQRSPMNWSDSTLVTHVLAGMNRSLALFEDAIGRRQFDSADNLFSKIQSQASFLCIPSHSMLQAPYATIEDASLEGWKRQADPDSEFSLQRAASSTTELNALLVASLQPWLEGIPFDFTPDIFIDSETVTFASMLQIAADDITLLSPELLRQLAASVGDGVQRGSLAAQKVFEYVLSLLEEHDMGAEATLSSMICAEAMAERIGLHLAASGLLSSPPEY